MTNRRSCITIHRSKEPNDNTTQCLRMRRYGAVSVVLWTVERASNRRISRCFKSKIKSRLSRVLFCTVGGVTPPSVASRWGLLGRLRQGKYNCKQQKTKTTNQVEGFHYLRKSVGSLLMFAMQFMTSTNKPCGVISFV